jgi:nucleoid DNA-binding protein
MAYMNDVVNQYQTINPNLTHKDAEQNIKDVLEAITVSLLNEGKVNLANYFNLEVGVRAEHQGMNPSTGEKITIPEKKVIRLKVTKALGERLNS